MNLKKTSATFIVPTTKEVCWKLSIYIAHRNQKDRARLEKKLIN
jgi:hypothetical protein